MRRHRLLSTVVAKLSTMKWKRRALSIVVLIMEKTAISIAYAIAIASGALAQDVRSDKSEAASTADSIKYTLDPVLVTATRSERPIYRVPYAIDVIEQDDIQRGRTGLWLDEALRALPGIMVHNRFNLSQGDRITLRGVGSRTPFGVRGIKIILDGIPLTMPDGQSLNNLDLASAGKIEILPTCFVFVWQHRRRLINIQTESAQTVPICFQPQFIAGSNGLLKWQGKLSGKIGKQAYFANVSRLQLDGHREHSAASTTALNAIGRHEISNRFSLTTLFNYFDAPYLLNPSSLSKTEAEVAPTATRFFIKQQGAGKQTRQGQGGLTFKYRRSESHQFEATLYGLSRALLNPIPGRIIELDRISGGVRAVFSQRFQAGGSQLRWTAGADYEAQFDTRVEFQNQGIPAAQVRSLKKTRFFAPAIWPAVIGSERAGLGNWSVFGAGIGAQSQVGFDSGSALRPLSS
jgi:iron complex outermembrane receptor protein